MSLPVAWAGSVLAPLVLVLVVVAVVLLVQILVHPLAELGPTAL